MVHDHLPTQVTWASAAEILTKFSHDISQFRPYLSPEELKDGSNIHKSIKCMIIWDNGITHPLALFNDLKISY